MYTLGINAAFHDPAACLVKDGRILAAAEEERFTRIKHGKRPSPFTAYELPFHAIAYCLEEAGLALGQVDAIAYSFDPYPLLGRHNDAGTIALPLEPSAHPVPEEWVSAWDPYFLASIVNAPRHLRGGIPHHLQQRFRLADQDPLPAWHFVPHHLAHAASAFYPSPFARAAILTLDGRGETATTTYGLGDGNRMELLGQVDFPQSLGLLYEQVTSYLGFLHSSDEYKVMALASYGRPRYAAYFRSLVQVGADGQYTVKAARFADELGPARIKGGTVEQRHFDIARSLQLVLEETVLELADWLHAKTGAENLVMAGGVALNCVMNTRLRDQGPFTRIWVQPAANDAGTAIGAALWIDNKASGGETHREVMTHAYLGPAYADGPIEELLRWAKLPYRQVDDVADAAAAILAQDKIIGWFQGRMEFGPRALGGRSILASPLSPGMQARLNDLKDREDFRPVAPAVLESEADQWFQGADVSPFMLFVHDVQPEKAAQIPAVRHVDGTARIQTVSRAQHSLYHDLLVAFAARTGVPVLVNTSFNTRGEPIVCTPHDALASFWSTPLDALVIGSFVVEKPEARP